MTIPYNKNNDEPKMIGKYKIEKGFVMPPRKEKKTEGLTAALRQLDIGDCIVVELHVNPRSVYPLAKQIGIKVRTCQEYSKEKFDVFDKTFKYYVKKEKHIGTRVQRVE